LPSGALVDGESASVRAPEFQAEAITPQSDPDAEVINDISEDAAAARQPVLDETDQRPEEGIDDLIESFSDAMTSRPETRGTADQGSDEDSPRADHQAEPVEPAQGKRETTNTSFASRMSRAVSKAEGAEENAGVRGTNSVASDAAGLLSARQSAGAEAPARTMETVQPPLTESSIVLGDENPFGDGLTSVLEFMRNDGISEARMVVDPPALGRVDISLQASANGVEAMFRVDNEQMKQALQQQIDALKISLEAQGIHVSGLTVDIKQREDQRSRGDLRDSGRRIRRTSEIGGDGDESQADGVRLARLNLEQGLLHWVA
jgi:flagellar hook-length control protein FliK